MNKKNSIASGSTKYDVDREYSKTNPNKYFLIRSMEAVALPWTLWTLGKLPAMAAVYGSVKGKLGL